MTLSFIHGRWIWSTEQEYCMRIWLSMYVLNCSWTLCFGRFVCASVHDFFIICQAGFWNVNIVKLYSLTEDTLKIAWNISYKWQIMYRFQLTNFTNNKLKKIDWSQVSLTKSQLIIKCVKSLFRKKKKWPTECPVFHHVDSTTSPCFVIDYFQETIAFSSKDLFESWYK